MVHRPLMMDVLVQVDGSDMVCVSVDASGTVGDLKRAIGTVAGLDLDAFDVEKLSRRRTDRGRLVTGSVGSSVASSLFSQFTASTPLSDAFVSDGETVRLALNRRGRARAQLRTMGIDSDYDAEVMRALCDNDAGEDDASLAAKVHLLLEAGARSEYGNTSLLHHAAMRGRLRTAELLYERGLSINAPAAHGDKPLHFAVMSSRAEMVKVLLSLGADVNASNAYGDTPLHVAANVGDREIIGLLLAEGADASLKNLSGRAALDPSQHSAFTSRVTVDATA